jgi:hypothetical protein
MVKHKFNRPLRSHRTVTFVKITWRLLQFYCCYPSQFQLRWRFHECVTFKQNFFIVCRVFISSFLIARSTLSFGMLAALEFNTALKRELASGFGPPSFTAITMSFQFGKCLSHRWPTFHFLLPEFKSLPFLIIFELNLLFLDRKFNILSF